VPLIHRTRLAMPLPEHCELCGSRRNCVSGLPNECKSSSFAEEMAGDAGLGKRRRTDEERERDYQTAMRERQQKSGEAAPGASGGPPSSSSSRPAAAPVATAAVVSYAKESQGQVKPGRGRVDQRPAWMVALEGAPAVAAAAAVAADGDGTATAGAGAGTGAGAGAGVQVKKDVAVAPTAAGGAEDENEEDEEAAMQRLLGFSSFSSTAGTHVDDNDKAAAGGMSKSKQRKYRQYMNRTGGFNRALDKI